MSSSRYDVPVIVRHDQEGSFLASRRLTYFAPFYVCNVYVKRKLICYFKLLMYNRFVLCMGIEQRSGCRAKSFVLRAQSPREPFLDFLAEIDRSRSIEEDRTYGIVEGQMRNAFRG